MKTLIIQTDNDSTAKWLMELAKKLKLQARLLSKEEKEDAALLRLMEKRKNEPLLPIQTTYDILNNLLKKHS